MSASCCRGEGCTQRLVVRNVELVLRYALLLGVDARGVVTLLLRWLRYPGSVTLSCLVLIRGGYDGRSSLLKVETGFLSNATVPKNHIDINFPAGKRVFLTGSKFKHYTNETLSHLE